MKKLFLLTSACILAIFFSSCNKDIVDQTELYAALNPLRVDENAGTWKPILLTSPTEFPCAAPIATASPDYRIQINEIKSLQANITAAQEASIKYWSAGAVLRWNEIMRYLVAKNNIPPQQNADGTYSIPDPANPLAYPTFPFSTPPYAARAYAYLSAAQYDACIAAFHYKSQYGRVAPFTIDNSLKSFLPKSSLPSYPSEDAVIAGASVEILKLMFPGDQAFIIQKAEEHKLARLIAGANVRSDVESGESLGKLIAAKFVQRARTDRAGAAVGNQAIWSKLESDCVARGEVAWISQESPKRPPMLPLFGKVKTFLFDSLTMVTSLRSPAPPSTSSVQFKKELDEVYAVSTSLTREQLAIAHYWADGINTYTPPGHWNYIASNEFVSQRFSEARWARNMALLNMSLMDAAVACWDTKFTFFQPRPSQMNPLIKTVTGIPNFPSYISGHSTFSGAAATVLGYIIPTKSNDYLAMANQASLSRLYGAIHYRSDCDNGLILGKKVASFAVMRGRIDGAE